MSYYFKRIYFKRYVRICFWCKAIVPFPKRRFLRHNQVLKAGIILKLASVLQPVNLPRNRV